MSLTSFIDNSAKLRARLLIEFKKPEFWLKADIKARPLTASYGLTGTAFHYLLSFYVAKLNPTARTSSWTAEGGLALLARNKATFIAAKGMFEKAQSLYEEFLSSSRQRPTRELAEACVRLAYLEIVYRRGILDKNAFKRIAPAILDDLEAMLVLVRAKDFRSTKRCVVNPTFGSASALVGGADADLILDDTLIDIKTGKHLVFDREVFNQLLGYYLLSCMGGIDNCSRGAIKYLAVYYARYGVLHRVEIADFVVKNGMPAFLKWFKSCASRELS